LAGAKNLAEALELQTAYWRKRFGDLTAQAEEMRTLATKVTADVAAPIQAQVTGDLKGLQRGHFLLTVRPVARAEPCRSHRFWNSLMISMLDTDVEQPSAPQCRGPRCPLLAHS
jgi:hypothetical protein